MTTLNNQQLRALPLDVIIEHIVPLLASQKKSVDDWALKLLEWTSPRDCKKINDLEEYDAVAEYHHSVVVSDSPLTAFTIFGPEDIPFSMYKALDAKNKEQVTPLMSWMYDMNVRRSVQRVKSTGFVLLRPWSGNEFVSPSQWRGYTNHIKNIAGFSSFDPRTLNKTDERWLWRALPNRVVDVGNWKFYTADLKERTLDEHVAMGSLPTLG